MFLRYLISGCLFLIPFSCVAAGNVAPPDFLDGHLKIVLLGAVESSDELPRPAAVAPETYAQYPLIILSPDEKKEIARATADENGNYRVSLPPGAYILDVQGRQA